MHPVVQGVGAGGLLKVTAAVVPHGLLPALLILSASEGAVWSEVGFEALLVEELALRDLSHQQLHDAQQLVHSGPEAQSYLLGCLAHSLRHRTHVSAMRIMRLASAPA